MCFLFFLLLLFLFFSFFKSKKKRREGFGFCFYWFGRMGGKTDIKEFFTMGGFTKAGNRKDIPKQHWSLSMAKVGRLRALLPFASCDEHGHSGLLASKLSKRLQALRATPPPCWRQKEEGFSIKSAFITMDSLSLASQYVSVRMERESIPPIPPSVKAKKISSKIQKEKNTQHTQYFKDQQKKKHNRAGRKQKTKQGRMCEQS